MLYTMYYDSPIGRLLLAEREGALVGVWMEGQKYFLGSFKEDREEKTDSGILNKTKEWLENLERELEGKNPDYLVISHLEPDHSGSIDKVLEKYPNLKIISNEKVFLFFLQFIDIDFEDRKVVV